MKHKYTDLTPRLAHILGPLHMLFPMLGPVTFPDLLIASSFLCCVSLFEISLSPRCSHWPPCLNKVSSLFCHLPLLYVLWNIHQNQVISCSHVFIFCYLSSPILIPTLGEQESCSLLYPPTLKIMPNIRGLFINNVKWISVLMTLLCGPKLSGSQDEERRILPHACLAQDPIRCVLTDAVSKAPYILTVNLGTEALQLLLKVSSIKIKKNVKDLIVK